MAVLLHAGGLDGHRWTMPRIMEKPIDGNATYRDVVAPDPGPAAQRFRSMEIISGTLFEPDDHSGLCDVDHFATPEAFSFIDAALDFLDAIPA